MISLGALTRYLLRKAANGHTDVVDTQTGEVIFSGSQTDAMKARAELIKAAA